MATKAIMPFAHLKAAYDKIRGYLGGNTQYTSDQLAGLIDQVAGTGGEITVESLTVNANGTTTAPSGKAYSPVIVDVPNSYTQADEGKVVSFGALVAQTAHADVTPTTADKTIDTTGNNSVKVKGITPVKTSSDLTASGATVTAPAGFYEQDATKTVQSGTEGTPTATKGAVSNQTVMVTPSVTNAEGYIAGGTHTGQGVQVTAAELLDTLSNQAAAGDMRSGKSAYDGDGNEVQGTLVNIHQPSACYWDSQSNNGFAMTAAFRGYVEAAIATDGAATGYLVNTTTAVPIPVIIHPSTTAGKWTMTGGVTTGNNDDKYATQARIDPETGAIEAEKTYYIRAITTLSRNLADWGIQFLSIYVPV